MKTTINSLLIVMALIVIFSLVVKAVDPKDSETRIKNRVVKLLGKGGQCSGEQIVAPSGQTYILSAGHCSVIAVEGSIEVVSEQGLHIRRRVIAEDPRSDLLLLEGLPDLQGLRIAGGLSPAQHVRTFTHGGGMDTYKTEGEAIGLDSIHILAGMPMTPEAELNCKSQPKFSLELTPFGPMCIMNLDEMITTARVIPGSSGGPAVDDRGDLIGVVSCTREMFSGLVTLHDINAFLAGY